MKTKTTVMIMALLAWAGSAFCGFGQDATQKPAAPFIEVSGIDASRISGFAKWLDEKGMDPVEYVVGKCREHQLVIVGESHYVKDQVEFFSKAAVEAYHKTGVRVIALECANAEDNEKIARLVNAAEYDIKLAYEIARSQNWGTWGYKEYWDVMKTVWELNRSLPAGSESMTVIGIDKAMDYQLDFLWREGKLKDQPALMEKAEKQPSIYDRDGWLADNLGQEILDKGRKGILLVGFNHSFTHYGQPRWDKERKNVIGTWDRMGVLLYKKYGDKVCQVGYHLKHEAPMKLREGDKGGEALLTSFIEKIMAARGNKPAGFDVPGSPFAGLRDNYNYYFYWEPDVRLEDLYRGYIFLKPQKDLTRCGWLPDFITDEMFEKSKAYYEYAFKRTFKNAREVDAFLASGKGES
jgi:hypothetical protein